MEENTVYDTSVFLVEGNKVTVYDNDAFLMENTVYDTSVFLVEGHKVTL